MHAFAWTAIGSIVGLVVGLTAARGRRPRTAASARPPAGPETALAADTDLPHSEPASRHMALSLAEELADLVSAVEGRTYHLIEAAPTRAQLPAAAEAAIEAIKRLRKLHTKLVSFGQGRTFDSTVAERDAAGRGEMAGAAIATSTTDVTRLVEGLGVELQNLQLGLEVHWDLPPDLPHIHAHHKTVRDALLFLCAALLRAERGATRLNCVAERNFAGDHPTIEIELSLERISASPRTPPDHMRDDNFMLDREAAHNLITACGGELTISHLPGKAARAVVSLPMFVEPDADANRIGGTRTATDPAPPAFAAPTAAPTPHDFGGALVLESDPALRAVLARELKASGRAVFACADGAAVHTFLEATPDRFELLILDDPRELAGDSALAHAIRARAPRLKVCVMTPTPSAAPRWPGAHCLKKPFGVHELRRTLASILDAG